MEISKLYKRSVKRNDPIPYEAFGKAWEAPEGARETFERLGLIQRDYEVKVESRGGRSTSMQKS